MKGPTIQSIFHYARFTLAMKPFLSRPGEGRMQPEIPPPVSLGRWRWARCCA